MSYRLSSGMSPKRTAQRSSFAKSVGLFVVSVLLAAAVFGGSAFGLFAYYAKDLPQVVNVDDRQLSQSTKIYDRTGETLLYKISGEKTRTVVEEEDISPLVRQAFMAAEDGNYYEHWGVQPRAIARAALVNIREGQTVQGGSTITQQFVKNALLNDDRTYVRKLKEAILAIQLELRYSKDEIFTMYLNEIPFGSNIAGIEAAAQTYFNKSADELTAHEAATLATIPRAPSYYSPYGSNRDALEARQKAILNIMNTKGFISDATLQTSLQRDIKVEPFDQNIKAPHFVFYVRDVLREKLGRERLRQGGLRVRTSLHYDLHKKAQDIVKKHVEDEVAAYGGNNGALAAVDPANGQILTLVGSRDYYDKEHDGQVNIMTSVQSPGSSMKPFVYASAFEKGYNPQTKLFDLPTDFGNYEPENFDGQYRGPVSIAKALTRSLNIPAVKALHLTGVGDFFKLGRDLGIDNYTNEAMRTSGLSAAIGGANLRPLEEVGAYATLADGGRHDPMTPIVNVTNNKEEELEEFQVDSDAEEQVLDRQAALQVTDILSEEQPVPASMRIDGVDVASKTGTSQDFRDSLTMGYTTNLAAGVWTGNNSNKPMAQGAYGSDVAAPMWKDFMTTALDTLETSPGRFAEPNPVETDKPMVGGEHVFEEEVKVNRITGKRATENTPPQLVNSRTYKQVHSILHYVNKKNPLGPIPDNPQLDPQYKHWEPPVRDWAQDQDFNLGNPPNEEDTAYNDGKQPSVSVTNLSDGFSIDGNQNSSFTVKTSVSAERPVEKVEFFLNGSIVKTINDSPYNAELDTPDKGAHTLSVSACDNVLSCSEKVKLNFNVDKDEKAPRILKFKAEGGPKTYELSAKVREPHSGLQKVEFWEETQGKKLATRNVSGNGPKTVEYTYDPDTPKTPYKFYVKVFDKAGNVSTSDTLKRPSDS